MFSSPLAQRVRNGLLFYYGFALNCVIVYDKDSTVEK